MYYNNHNLHISATNESIYSYVDNLVETTSNVISNHITHTSNQLVILLVSTSNTLIDYTSNNILLTSNALIEYVKNSSNIIQGDLNSLLYNYRKTSDFEGAFKNPLLYGDKKIEFDVNNKINTRIDSNANAEIYIDYDPNLDPQNYRIINDPIVQLTTGLGPKWISLRKVYLDELFDEISEKWNNVVRTVSGKFIEYVSDGISMADTDGLFFVGGIVGTTMAGGLVASGIIAYNSANEEENSQNNEKLMYNRLFKTLIILVNQHDVSIQDLYLYKANKADIAWTSNLEYTNYENVSKYWCVVTCIYMYVLMYLSVIASHVCISIYVYMYMCGITAVILTLVSGFLVKKTYNL